MPVTANMVVVVFCFSLKKQVPCITTQDSENELNSIFSNMCTTSTIIYFTVSRLFDTGHQMPSLQEGANTLLFQEYCLQ